LNSDRALEIYIIECSRGRTILFAPTDVIEFFEAQSDDRIRKVITWLEQHRSRVLAWLGRMFQTARRYYMKLEARLDPIERVLKAMDSSGPYVVFHSPTVDADKVRKHLFARLRWQRVKHLIWVVVDLPLSLASLTIAFLPGPNVLGWYPFLRSLSHYRAFRGTRRFLGSESIEFKGLPELRSLEENLKPPSFDRVRIQAIVENLKLSGLEEVLERMI
jgi:hypothetical protein